MISIFDTSIASYNTGNQIIMDAVLNIIDSLFPQEFLLRLPIEDISTNARKYNSSSRFSFIGGTNLLNADIRKYRQWDLNLHNIIILKRCILLGCGWFQYETKPITTYTKWAFHKILHPNLLHSVRDEYTRNKLASIGIKSINTGCPTLWQLDPSLPLINGKNKSIDCVVALTDYNKSIERDTVILESIAKNYRKIYIFPQGTGDEEYIRALLKGNTNKFQILRPRLEAFNNILSTGTDYIGTRLHAGIRALQLNQRSIIIGIDNRAIEMAKDFGLPVINTKDINSLHTLINSPFKCSLSLPLDNIHTWKKQFNR